MTDPGIAYDPTIWRHYDPLGKPHVIPTAGIFEEPTIKLCINTTWLGHIAGMVDRLAWADAWQGTEDEVNAAIQQIYQFFDACGQFQTGGCSMGDCCAGSPAGNKPVRFSPTSGLFQVSYDNGATWVDSPSLDPRNAILVYPDVRTTSGYDKKCEAANSIRTAFKDQFDQQATNLQNSEGLATIAATVISLLILAGILATGGLFAAIGAALAVFITRYTYSAWTALDTTAWWQGVTCAVYLNLTNDGVLDQTGYAAVPASLAGQVTSELQTWFTSIWQALGLNAANNLIASNIHHDDYNCAICENPCLLGWTIDNTYGASSQVVGQVLRVHSDTTPRGDGKYYIVMNRADETDCCQETANKQIVSGGDGEFDCYWKCGDTGFPSSGYTCDTESSSHSLWAFSIKFNEQTVVDFIL